VGANRNFAGVGGSSEVSVRVRSEETAPRVGVGATRRRARTTISGTGSFVNPGRFHAYPQGGIGGRGRVQPPITTSASGRNQVDGRTLLVFGEGGTFTLAGTANIDGGGRLNLAQSSATDGTGTFTILSNPPPLLPHPQPVRTRPPVPVRSPGFSWLDSRTRPGCNP